MLHRVAKVDAPAAASPTKPGSPDELLDELELDELEELLDELLLEELVLDEPLPDELLLDELLLDEPPLEELVPSPPQAASSALNIAMIKVFLRIVVIAPILAFAMALTINSGTMAASGLPQYIY